MSGVAGFLVCLPLGAGSNSGAECLLRLLLFLSCNAADEVSRQGSLAWLLLLMVPRLLIAICCVDQPALGGTLITGMQLG